MAPVQRTRSIPATPPDLLVYLFATVFAITVRLVLEHGFDRSALALDRSRVLETTLAVLSTVGLAGLLCLLVPLMRQLIHRSR